MIIASMWLERERKEAEQRRREESERAEQQRREESERAERRVEAAERRAEAAEQLRREDAERAERREERLLALLERRNGGSPQRDSDDESGIAQG